MFMGLIQCHVLAFGYILWFYFRVFQNAPRNDLFQIARLSKWGSDAALITLIPGNSALGKFDFLEVHPTFP